MKLIKLKRTKYKHGLERVEGSIPKLHKFLWFNYFKYNWETIIPMYGGNTSPEDILYWLRLSINQSRWLNKTNKNSIYNI